MAICNFATGAALAAVLIVPTLGETIELAHQRLQRPAPIAQAWAETLVLDLSGEIAGIIGHIEIP